MKQNLPKPATKGSTGKYVIGILVVCILLMLISSNLFFVIAQDPIHDPDLETDLNLNNYPATELPLWTSELDFTQDSLSLISVNDRVKFHSSFPSISFKISGLPIASFEDPTMVSSDIEQIYEKKFDADLTLEESTPEKIIRKHEAAEIELKHMFELTKTNTNALKQSVSIYNPTNMNQQYIATFVFESPFKTIKFNEVIQELTSEPTRFDDYAEELCEIILMDDQFVEQCSFDWKDLIRTDLEPNMIGYHKDGVSVFECSLAVEVLPKSSILLDPSYIIINIANLQLFHEEDYSRMGESIVTGDFNADGYSDIAFTAPEADSGLQNERFRAGEAYIVFGNTSDKLGTYMNFSHSEDIIIFGESTTDSLVDSILTTGDINNDGIDDLVIGAPMANEDRGYVYAIFGSKDLNYKKIIDLDNLYDYNMRVSGPAIGAKAGTSIAVGDVNGDKFGDLIIGCPWATYDNGTIERDMCGSVYVIFGNTSMDSSYKLNFPSHYDMRILGEDDFDYIAKALASGDINGDGIDDIIIGTPDKDTRKPEIFKAGYVDIIFGNTNLPALWDLRNYANLSAAPLGILNTNVSIKGAYRDNQIGKTLKVANLNDDQYDDLLIGVPFGKGKSGLKEDTGEIYIIYGDSEENLIKFMDARNMTRDGYIIYGKDDGDHFGWALAAGDLDGDGTKDLIIGAPYAWGVGDDARNTGESYIIYGKPEKQYGFLEIETIIGTSGIVTLYGNKTKELSGFSVAAGDLNSDGRSEIILGSPDADSINGTNLAVGRIDILFELNATPKITHKKLELIDGGGNDGDICYAGQEHTFRVEVFNSLGVKNLNFTQLSLEPRGPNVQLRWSQANDSFYEAPGSDIHHYATLNRSASYSKEINSTLYELNFVVIFNFTYPSHQHSSCQLYSLAYNLSVPAAINKYQDVFLVENHLDFVGELKLTGSFQGQLKDGDRVHNNETLIWSGLKVVFNGTTNIYPNDKYFDVAVWDDDGNFWLDKYSSGKEISIISKADSKNDPNDVHTVNITNIAGYGIGLSEVKFMINVVAMKIKFTQPTPDANKWHDSTNVTCSITIQDDASWRINGASIEYSISTNGSETSQFGSWVTAGESGLQNIITALVSPVFANGEDNYIRWRAKNEATELYSGSEHYRISVDIESLYYIDPVPDHITWQYDVAVQCSITILDNLSGVDSASIEYRFSTATTGDYSSWTTSDLTSETTDLVTDAGKGVVGYIFSVTRDFDSGTDNFIQWRGSDILGNSDHVSQDHRIKITSQEPVSILKSPKDKSKVESASIPLIWTGNDPNNDPITYDVFIDQQFSTVSGLLDSVKVATGYPATNYVINDLQNGGRYYWTVIPSDGNSIGVCQSEIWSFIVYIPAPKTTLIKPMQNSIISSTDVTFLWDIDYIGIEEVKYDLYFGTTSSPSLLASDLITTGYTHTGLDDGQSYYWYAIPKVGSIIGETIGRASPELMKFSIDLKQNAPEVVLKTPKDDTMIVILEPLAISFSWELIYTGPRAANITYDLFLGTSSLPNNIVKSGITTTNVILNSGLEDNKTYYWQIIPRLDNIEGVCQSGVWSFTTTAVDPAFDISLEFDNKNLKLSPGEKGSIKFTVFNLANIADTITIGIVSEEFDIDNLELDQSSFILSSGSSADGVITVRAPKNINETKYNVTLIANSAGAAGYGSKVETTEEFTITILKKKDTNNIDFSIGLAIIGIMICIIIVIFALSIINRSKSLEKQKRTEETRKPSSQEIGKKTRFHPKSSPEDRSRSKKGSGRDRDMGRGPQRYKLKDVIDTKRAKK